MVICIPEPQSYSVHDQLQPKARDLSTREPAPVRRAIHVYGNCLEPEISDSECVLIDKTAPYKVGDLVMIYRRREVVPPGQDQLGIGGGTTQSPVIWLEKSVNVTLRRPIHTRHGNRAACRRAVFDVGSLSRFRAKSGRSGLGTQERAMQSASLITPLSTSHLGSIVALLYRRSALHIWYVKIEILPGFNVFVPRFGNHSAILTYNILGRRGFKYHISRHDLDDLFTMLEICEDAEKDHQFIIGRFGFRVSTVRNFISVWIDYVSHDVEIIGLRSQLEPAIVAYRSLRPGQVRSPKSTTYARNSTIERP
jgi:hypothetical protein